MRLNDDYRSVNFCSEDRLSLALAFGIIGIIFAGLPLLGWVLGD